MKPLGIISGTLNLGQAPVEGLREVFCETDFGPAQLFVSDQVVYLPRHGADPHNHILPHMINQRANLVAMQAMGVSEIIGINSTGSLKAHLKPGMLVVPDDYMVLSAIPSIFANKAVHITPALDQAVRQRLLAAAGKCGAEAVNGGVYWQTAGPRLETRAEIRFMSQYADLAGMTMASEAITANELTVPYASLCSVDNFAHGLIDNALTQDEILENSRKNRDLIGRIIRCYIENRTLE